MIQASIDSVTLVVQTFVDTIAFVVEALLNPIAAIIQAIAGILCPDGTAEQNHPCNQHRNLRKIPILPCIHVISPAVPKSLNKTAFCPYNDPHTKRLTARTLCLIGLSAADLASCRLAYGKDRK